MNEYRLLRVLRLCVFSCQHRAQMFILGNVHSSSIKIKNKLVN